MVTDPLIVVATLADIFDQLGIPYLVGGSLASSLYGVPQATQDADILADVRLHHVEPLTKLLEKDFDVAGELISDAIRDHSSFNVIHLVTMFKADIFTPTRDISSRQEMARARIESIQMAQDTRAVRFESRRYNLAQVDLVSSRRRNLGQTMERHTRHPFIEALQMKSLWAKMTSH